MFHGFLEQQKNNVFCYFWWRILYILIWSNLLIVLCSSIFLLIFVLSVAKKRVLKPPNHNCGFVCFLLLITSIRFCFYFNSILLDVQTFRIIIFSWWILLLLGCLSFYLATFFTVCSTLSYIKYSYSCDS